MVQSTFCVGVDGTPKAGRQGDREAGERLLVADHESGMTSAKNNGISLTYPKHSLIPIFGVACQPIADTGASEGQVDLGFGPEIEPIFNPNPAYPSWCIALKAL